MYRIIHSQDMSQDSRLYSKEGIRTPKYVHVRVRDNKTLHFDTLANYRSKVLNSKFEVRV